MEKLTESVAAGKARLTIKEAAEAAGISRSHLYKEHINADSLAKRISVCRDEKGKPYIEAAELARLYPRVLGASPETRKDVSAETGEDTEKTREDTKDAVEKALLRAENDALRERVRELEEARREAREREEWMRGQVEKLTDTVRLLEAPKPAPPSGPGWWARTFGRKP